MDRIKQKSLGKAALSRYLFAALLLGLWALPSVSCIAQGRSRKKAPPISIEGLRQRTYESNLAFEQEMEGAAPYRADLMSYTSDGLKVYTLVNTPTTKAPKKGFPVLIFGHGYHPNPPKYGINPDPKENRRPGDYYQGLQEAYAEKGFLVLTPDYRGHSNSEGYEYTQTGYLASNYYAIDVLNLIAALKTLKNADLKNVYYVGHSLGGDVGLKMLLATDKIRAASLWAPVVADSWEQALFYGTFYDEKSDLVDTTRMQLYAGHIDKNIRKLGYPYTAEEGDPINYMSDISIPLIIHHAKEDDVVPFTWSVALVAKLYKFKKLFELYSYNGKDHLLQNEMRAKAVERDVDFFKRSEK
ncbi:MAG: alpha/beta fold hydrolase [Lewinellaceae bacterium]|nr:alpha/beta fold hydrolase [Lewinellaceae bacterium]